MGRTPKALINRYAVYYHDKRYRHRMVDVADHFGIAYERLRHIFRHYKVRSKPRGKNVRRIPEERFQEVRILYRQGVHPKEIAKQTGVDYTTILKWRDRYNWPRQERISRETKETILRLHEQGWDNAAIGREVGWSRMTISRRLKEWVRPRPPGTTAGWWCGCGAYAASYKEYQDHKRSCHA